MKKEIELGLPNCPFCESKPRLSVEKDFVSCSNEKCTIAKYWFKPEEWDWRMG